MSVFGGDRHLNEKEMLDKQHGTKSHQATARLEEAVSVLREALKECTREQSPVHWAVAQVDLGSALAALGERESGTGRLEEAVLAYKAAIVIIGHDSQDIYRNRSKLVVVFLGGDYQRKDWCGIEFRAIKEIILERDHKKIMFVRMDDSPVDGVFKTDGYIDGRKFNPQEIAYFICERIELIP